MSSKSWLAAGVIAIGVGYGAPAARAQTVAASVTGTYGTSSGAAVRGWEFTVGASPLTLTDLGFSDQNGDGLTNSHPVLLWRSSDAALIASTTVVSADPLISGFRYKSVSPITLQAGTSYVIGAFQENGDADKAIGAISSSVITTSDLTYVNGRFPTSTGLGLVMPTNSVAVGVFGANFRYTVGAADTPAVPEPGALALFLPALAVAALARLRKPSPTRG